MDCGLLWIDSGLLWIDSGLLWILECSTSNRYLMSTGKSTHARTACRHDLRLTVHILYGLLPPDLRHELVFWGVFGNHKLTPTRLNHILYPSIMVYTFALIQILTEIERLKCTIVVTQIFLSVSVQK